MAGLGFTRETDTQQAAQAVIPQPAAKPREAPKLAAKLPEPPQNNLGIPDNPLSKIGFLLQQASAGMRGQETPLEKIRRAQAQQKQADLQRLRVTLDAVQNGVDLFGGLDPSDPKTAEAVGKYASQFTNVLGEDFENSLNAGLELSRQKGRSAINRLGEHQERIHEICGLDTDCIVKTASDPKMMEQFNITADRERLPGIMEKFKILDQVVGEDKTLIESLRKNGFTLDDLKQFPEGFQFTDEEIITISRNEEIQDALISVGLRLPGIERISAEAEVKEAAKAKFREPKGAVKPKTSALSVLQDERDAARTAGNIERVKELEDLIDKTTTIVGRTKEDILSANRVDEIRAERGRTSQAQVVLQKVVSSIEQKRSRAGAAGTVVRGFQTALGIAGDFAQLGIDVDGTIEALTPDFIKDLNEGLVDEDINRFFDAALPRNQVFEHRIAYALAKVRKGNVRINLEDFKIALKDVNLTGLTSADNVLARLSAVNEEFDEALIGLDARIKQEELDAGLKSLPTYGMREDGTFGLLEE